MASKSRQGPSQAAQQSRRKFNMNVGVLGHVDCGKTSLVAAMSDTLSTAALDKNPQSQQRGITLDLGFSSFTVPFPEGFANSAHYDSLQVTLVDCPGHADLLRTIVGGAQIIDLILLVVDVTKGLEPQTAECLVLSEIVTNNMIMVLNKIDLFPENVRERNINAASRRLRTSLRQYVPKFYTCPFVPVAAKPGGAGSSQEPAAIPLLKQLITHLVPQQPRPIDGPFFFVFDHCFALKGRGTIFTGTIMQGRVSVGDTVELPEVSEKKPVKSLQAFHEPVRHAGAGDRVGLCLVGVDASRLERGVVATPGSVPAFHAAVATADKMRFHMPDVRSGSRVHVLLGHRHFMAEVTFFGLADVQCMPIAAYLDMVSTNLVRLGQRGPPAPFSWDMSYVYQDRLWGLEGRPVEDVDRPPGAPAGVQAPDGSQRHFGPQWVLMKFDKEVVAPADSLLIGSKLDVEPSANLCRLSFYGQIVSLLDPNNAEQLARLQVYKPKQRMGTLERVLPGGREAVLRGLFRKETDQTRFRGCEVVTGAGERGRLDMPFGKSGKVRASFPGGLAAAPRPPEADRVFLQWKRPMFGNKAAIRQ